MTEPRWRRYLRFFQFNPAADVDDELRFHFEQRVEQYRASGMSHDAALAEARRQFGDVDGVRHDLVAIDTRIGRAREAALWWDALRTDLRTSVRSLARQPGFSAAVIVTLALGLGVNAAMFSFLDRVYLRMPANVVDPHALRRLWAFEHDDKGTLRAYQLRSGGAEFDSIKTAIGGDAEFSLYARQFIVRFDDDPTSERVIVRADKHYFPLLGARARLGRFFTAEEAKPDAPAAVAVISNALWQARYGGTDDVLGKKIAINGKSHTIIGVVASDFSGIDLEASDVWIPRSTQAPGVPGFRIAGPPRDFFVVARIRPGANEQRIEAIFTTFVRRSNAAFPKNDSSMTVATGSIIEARGPGKEKKEIVLASRLGTVALLVLLIAVANVINLLLARAVARRREIAVRVALGVSRARLVWLLAVPVITLALSAGVVAAGSAQITGAILRAQLLPDVHFADAPIHWRVVAFTLLAALTAGAIAAVVPAIQASKPDVTAFLKAGAQTGATHRSRLRTALVVIQAAVSVILLVGAGLFIRSVQQLNAIPLGYDVSRLSFASASYRNGMPIDSARLEYAAERLRHMRGIDGVSSVTYTPMGGGMLGVQFYTAADSGKGEWSERPMFSGVSDEYFVTTGVRILRGRDFRGLSGRNVIVNDAFARKYWPAGDAVGQCMRLNKPSEPCYSVVGVAENAHVRQVIEQADTPQFYVPLRYKPFKGMGAYALVLRGDPARAQLVLEAARRTLRDVFPGSDVRVQQMETKLAAEYRPFRRGAWLFGAFGVLALIVAMVGVYSSVSYGVSQRMHEFGVRVALGAGLRDVIAPVVNSAIAPVLFGIAIGVGIAFATGRFIESLLYGVSVRDARVIIAVTMTLIATALVAALIPARRAAGVDPMISLRAE